MDIHKKVSQKPPLGFVLGFVCIVPWDSSPWSQPPFGRIFPDIFSKSKIICFIEIYRVCLESPLNNLGTWVGLFVGKPLSNQKMIHVILVVTGRSKVFYSYLPFLKFLVPWTSGDFYWSFIIFRCYCWWKKSQTTTWDVYDHVNKTSCCRM